MDQPSSESPDLYTLWLNAFQAVWRVPDPAPRRAAESEATRLLRLWLQTLGGLTGPTAATPFAEAMARLLGASDAAAEPLSVWTTWYERHGEALAGALDEVLRSPAFVRASARALDDYASAFAAQRRAAAQAARALPFATRDDVIRVARMVVALEAKIERLVEQEESRASTREEGILGREVAALADRLERIEATVDRLMAARATAAPAQTAPRRRNTGAKTRTPEVSQAASTSRKRQPARDRQRSVRLVGGGPTH
jgi:hypothetical protein